MMTLGERRLVPTTLAGDARNDGGSKVAHAGDGTRVARAGGGVGKADVCVRDTGGRQDICSEHGDAGADGPEGSG